MSYINDIGALELVDPEGDQLFITPEEGKTDPRCRGEAGLGIYSPIGGVEAIPQLLALLGQPAVRDRRYCIWDWMHLRDFPRLIKIPVKMIFPDVLYFFRRRDLR